MRIINEDDMEKCGVYAIICTKNNKKYIGSTRKSFLQRYKTQLLSLNKNCASFLLQLDWNKYGAYAFEFEIIKVCDASVAYAEEQKAIDDTDKDMLYNTMYKVAGASEENNKKSQEKTLSRRGYKKRKCSNKKT